MPGVFDIKTPSELLSKLGRELERLRADSSDADHAFNFFVTAEHMLDWLYPTDPQKRKLEREKPLLALVSHLASGAKHFDRLSGHHKSVSHSGMVSRNPNPMMRRRFPDELSISVTGEAATAFGASRITAISLAQVVYNYWSEPGRF